MTPPAVIAAAIGLAAMGAGPVLDLVDDTLYDVGGFDVRGRRRRATGGAARLAQAQGRAHGMEAGSEAALAEIMRARMGPRSAGPMPRSDIRGAVLGGQGNSLMERHREALAGVEKSRAVPASLREMALRAGVSA